MQQIGPTDIQLGNFISVFGRTELICGITPRPDGSFFIHHSSSNQEDNPFGDGIEYNAYAIPLDEEWKVALHIEHAILPPWIKYVHQAQNYFKWYIGEELTANLVIVPLHQDFELFESE